MAPSAEREVPRDRDGTFSTALFERYQRSEKHEEWSTGRCYQKMDEFYQWKASARQEASSEREPLPIAA